MGVVQRGLARRRPDLPLPDVGDHLHAGVLRTNHLGTRPPASTTGAACHPVARRRSTHWYQPPRRRYSSDRLRACRSVIWRAGRAGMSARSRNPGCGDWQGLVRRCCLLRGGAALGCIQYRPDRALQRLWHRPRTGSLAREAAQADAVPAGTTGNHVIQFGVKVADAAGPHPTPPLCCHGRVPPSAASRTGRAAAIARG